MRSPAVTLLTLGSLLSCQVLCTNGRAEQRATSFHESGSAESSGYDPCCDTKQAPANPSDKSSCCDSCCCSGAVLTQPPPLEHLNVTSVISLPWFVPLGEVEPKHTVIDPDPVSRPPESALGTIVLLI